MLILTAKLDKRKLIGGILALVVLVAAAILIFSSSGGDAQTGLSAVVRNNEQRVRYLESFGWKVTPEPVEEQTITIPRDFSKVYSDYNELQLSQGFDLKRYAGFEAVRYTYEITNHPETTERVVADIVVYRGEVIAADVQCLSSDGFMRGIAFPTSTGS